MKPVNPQQVVVRATASHKGRMLSVTPADSPMKRLHYGRILLDQAVPKARFETNGREVGLLCMAGQCVVQVNGGDTIGLGRYDAVYVPRGSTVEVSTGSSVDLVECGAEVEGDYPLQVVRYRDIEQDPALKFTAGGDATKRELSILIGKNVDAGRIVAGFTRSAPGNWTSWPPHEHTEILEEMYVYFDMPPPAFGVQLVYTTPESPEVVTVVRDGDAVLMPAGYHPNVAAPGHAINFIWLMAAHREREDRVFGVVNVQPEFSQRGSGLEASLK
ncbi:5-deoxy-glucuronate isomerase [Sorangium sp. So ce1335]|uniref:5-deoxy-glucuronate isomerase n=1 Tax=Sorangium sp. So ce1335 TaxID=3133335 RepID=UPI003F6247F9